MPRNGSGGYSPPTNTWNPAVNGVTATAADYQAVLDDLSTAMAGSVAKDGQTAMTGNLQMGANRITGVAAASAITDAANANDVQSGRLVYLTSAAGSNTITASLTGFTAYAAGNSFRFIVAATNTAAATLNINGVGVKAITKAGAVPLSPGDLQINSVVEVSYDGTQFQLLGTPGASVAQTNGFRLTLTTGLPVTTADVTGAATLYACPYKGNQIALFASGVWALYSSAQFSLALTALASGRPYDVFCYSNAGIPALEFLVWTNDSTRATALAYQDGVLVKSGDATRRYLGTFYTTGTTTTEDSVAKRYLWNYYHRVRRDLLKTDATATWTYTTAAYRQANGSAANQVEAVIGVAEDVIEIEVAGMTENSGGANPATVGIGVDSATVNSSVTNQQSLAGATRAGLWAKYRATPAAGRHFYTWLEFAVASGTQTWYGTSTNIKSAIHGSVLA